MNLNDLADRIDAVGDAVADAGSALERLDPGVRAFGGHAPGSLGQLGRDLHAGWTAGVAARVREAAAHRERLADLGTAVRGAHGGYQEIDHEVRRKGTSAGEV